MLAKEPGEWCCDRNRLGEERGEFMIGRVGVCSEDKMSWKPSMKGKELTSTNVMINPESTCHSIWQWKSQTPGLSALKRMTRWPFGLTRMTSRRIGLVGYTTEPLVTDSGSKSPDSSSPRRIVWKAWPCKWNGCLPGSWLFKTISTTLLCSRTKELVLVPYTLAFVANSPAVSAVYSEGTFGAT
jgi:hypothetical protein